MISTQYIPIYVVPIPIDIQSRGFLNTSTDATSYATGNFTPTASELLLAYYDVSRDSATPTTPTVTGHDGGTAWTLIASLAWATVTTNKSSIFLFACITGSSPGNGAVTFDHGATTHIGAEASVFEVSGADEGNGLVQTFVQTVLTAADPAFATSGSLTLASAGHEDNRAFSAWVHVAAEATTPQTSWTEIHDLSHTAPNRGSESQWRSDVFDTAAGASWTTSQTFGGIAFEIKAAGVVSAPNQVQERWDHKFQAIFQSIILCLVCLA